MKKIVNIHVNVGNIDDEQVEKYLNNYIEKYNKFDDEDIYYSFIPVRSESTHTDIYYLDENKKTIFNTYFDVGNMEEKDVDDYLKKVSERINYPEQDNVLYNFLPIRRGRKLLEEQKQLLRILEQSQSKIKLTGSTSTSTSDQNSNIKPN